MTQMLISPIVFVYSQQELPSGVRAFSLTSFEM